jgi:hypothetical protein
MRTAALTIVAVAAAGTLVALAAAQTQKPAEKPTEKIEKIDPVAVLGCLREAPEGTWKLVDASDPVPSTANAPTPKELAALDKPGRNEFQLVGVSIFNLPVFRNHWVVVKGLPISANPVSRLNVTSVTRKADNCPAPPPPQIG